MTVYESLKFIVHINIDKCFSILKIDLNTLFIILSYLLALFLSTS